MTKVLLIASVALVAVGCASRPDAIAPMAISASEYSSLSCDETRHELELAREREYALSRQQNRAATTDAASVFLFALPLGSVFGGDVEGELSQVKGEVLALERAVRINCD